MPKPTTVYSWTNAVELIHSKILAGTVRHLSVDVFDTLLIRTTTPESVIAATTVFVARKLGVSQEKALSARHSAWAAETATAIKSGKDPDCESTSLFSRWIALLAGDADNSALVESALEFELANEVACLAPNPPMVKLLEIARQHGVKVTALSDMYLSPVEVTGLLTAHGMNELVGEIFTSGHLGLQKRTGRLFDWFVGKMNGTDGLLHVGDDLIADGTMPTSRGISSVCVFDKQRMFMRQRLASSSNAPARQAALSALESHVPKFVAHDVGYSRFGPIYTGFIHGVAARAASDGVSSVWFLAREGWLLHELYSSIRSSGLEENAPPSGYLYASRVATMRAQLEQFGKKEVASVHSDTWSREYRSTLSPLQLDDATLEELMEGVGLLPHDTVTDEGLRLLQANAQFCNAVKTIGETERKGLKSYLENIGFPMSGKVALVDVGWGGQIQENFERALRLIGATTTVVGYYLGTDERAEQRREDAGMVMHGIVVDKCNNDGAGLGAFSHVQGIELATRAAHGSVKGYSIDGMPRLASEMDKGRKTETLDDPAISTMQEGIIAYADAYLRVANVLGVDAAQSLEMARDVLDVASIMPTKREAEIVAKMKNIANLGGDETLRLGASVSLRRPRQAMRVLRTTLWQEGTCATLVPGIGPVLFLVLRRFKRRVPHRTGTASIPPTLRLAVPHDTVLEDALALELSVRRSELSASYAGKTAGTGIGIATFTDSAKLLIIRRAHGASCHHAVLAMRTEIKAKMKFILSHPLVKGLKQFGKRLF
jgi:FMN phosphatase YigB (HAD superfamily)